MIYKNANDMLPPVMNELFTVNSNSTVNVNSFYLIIITVDVCILTYLH